ncbi:MAG: purine-nucleoside phosphorylase [Anaerolineae bacterium]|nr:purine-nucleoside phosphorylase [Anaerolineae bacterium]
MNDRARFQEVADTVLARTGHRPAVAMVLGSGLGPLAGAVEDADIIPYDDLPHWPKSTVPGHRGRLVAGRLEDQAVLVMQGRIHYYEGYSMAQVTLPVRVMHLMGIKTLFVTNAAGGLDKHFRTGDLMLITDHINLIGMVGEGNPLRGPNDDALGPRFPSMNRAYDRALQDLARRAAAQAGVPLREGVYICLSGPSFETPADIRMLRLWGADAVGMSTVPEVVVARHMNMRVLGISGITNVAIDSNEAEGAPNHEEVLEAGKQIAPRMEAILRGVLRML